MDMICWWVRLRSRGVYGIVEVNFNLDFRMRSCSYIKMLLVGLSLLLFISCHDSGDDDASDDNTDSDPVEHTFIMFFPWSNNLTSYFYTNISDMKSAVAGGILDDERIIVCFEKSAGYAELFELKYNNGVCTEELYKTYDNSFTTIAEISTMLNDVADIAPASKYSISIGCHGFGWIPVDNSSASSVAQRAPAADYQNPHYTYTGDDGLPLTRYYGGTASEYQTDISTLRDAIKISDIDYMEYILFDDCYMANIEVAYDLRDVAGYLIASPTEIMFYGFPYELIGEYLIGDADYASVVSGYYDFYSTYSYPYGTIGVINCSEVEAMAEIMAEINTLYDYNDISVSGVQRMDGYSPVIFYDFGSYVEALCADEQLLATFKEQLSKLVPDNYKAHTEKFASAVSSWSGGLTTYNINSYSGVTISDPTTSSKAYSYKFDTNWYKATHPSGDSDE